MKKSAVFMTLGVVVAAAFASTRLAWSSHTQSPPPTPVEEASPSDSSDALGRRIARLEGSIRSLQNSHGMLASQLASLRNGVRSHPGTFEGSTTESNTDSNGHTQAALDDILARMSASNEEAKALTQANGDALAERFLAEAPDPGWSNWAAEELGAQFLEAGLETAFVEANCQSTMCRVDFQADKSGDPQQDLFAMMRATGWNTQAIVRWDPSMAGGALFIAREGHSLPMAEAP